MERTIDQQSSRSSALEELKLFELKVGLAKDNRKREILLYSGSFLLRLVDVQEP